MSRAAAISRKVREFVPKSFKDEANPPVFSIKSVPEEEKYTLMAGIFGNTALSQKFTDHEAKDEIIAVGDGKTVLFDLKHPNIEPESLSIKVGKRAVKGAILFDGTSPKLSVSVAPKEKEEVIGSYKYKLPVVDDELFKSLAGNAKTNRLEVERLVEKGYITGWKIIDVDGEDLPFGKENVVYIDSGVRSEVVMEISGMLSSVEIKNSEKSSELGNGSETTRTELGSADTAKANEASPKVETALI